MLFLSLLENQFDLHLESCGPTSLEMMRVDGGDGEATHVSMLRIYICSQRAVELHSMGALKPLGGERISIGKNLCEVCR